MRLESVPFETMLNELGQQRRDHPEWGITAAPAPLVQAVLQGHHAQAVTLSVPARVSAPTASRPRRAPR